ncbi:hypothetical protein V5799_021555 [Amblyomma americanum]|uniref:Uncharacterized protein n=1 Tax=Amblyomma americanum TaxID=6943 RepID=A0AAQ4FPU8_AMBAM
MDGVTICMVCASVLIVTACMVAVVLWYSDIRDPGLFFRKLLGMGRGAVDSNETKSTVIIAVGIGQTRWPDNWNNSEDEPVSPPVSYFVRSTTARFVTLLNEENATDNSGLSAAP